MRPQLSTGFSSAGEMKLLRKSSEVPLRLEAGSISLLQGKAGVAGSVCPETSLLQGDFINVPEGRMQRGQSQALLGGVLWWDQDSGCKLKHEIPLKHQNMFFTLPHFQWCGLSKGVMESPHFTVIEKHFGHSRRQISRGGPAWTVGLDQMISKSSFQLQLFCWKDHILRLKPLSNSAVLWWQKWFWLISFFSFMHPVKW